MRKHNLEKKKNIQVTIKTKMLALKWTDNFSQGHRTFFNNLKYLFRYRKFDF